MNHPLPPALTVESDAIDFPVLWRTMLRYRWRVLGITIIFAIMGMLDAADEKAVYRTTLSMAIEMRPDRPVQLQEVYDPGVGTADYLATQNEIVKSRELLGRVVDKLGLIRETEIVPPPQPPRIWQRMLAGDFGWLPFLPEGPPIVAPVESDLQKRERAVDTLRGRVNAYTVPGTRLMRVHVDGGDPELITRITNTIGDLFVESGLESRLDTTERATRWLTERLGDLRAQLERSEKALQAYREQHQLVNVGSARALQEEALVDNARKLREAQSKKTQLGSTYWKIQQADNDVRKLEEISALLLDPPVQRASGEVMAAETAIKQLQERYGEKHPQMAAAQARMQTALRAYHDQLRLAANGVKAEYEIAAETERALLDIVEGGKDQIRRLDQRDYQLRALEREALTNRELYDLFLKRFKETDTTGTYEPITARIVDPAIVPSWPVAPDKPKIVLLWTLGGLVLGIVLATLRHLLTETVRSPEQLEQLTQLPVLSLLPKVAGFTRKSPVKTCLEAPRAHFSESVRSIRASLYLNDVDKRMKRIMFTSALPREGKSSVTAGFAATLAQMERVLLVEADLRAPEQKQLFGIPKDAPGLMEALTGQVPV
jgi:polysaccharide biosynthesis transport protein